MPHTGFWYDVLKAWCSYNFEEETDIDSIMESPLWLNSELLINGKPMMCEPCMQHDVLYIKDLVANRNFLTYAEFTAKYGNIITFIKYYGILKAIPQHMKRIIREQDYIERDVATNHTKLIQKNLSSRDLYNLLKHQIFFKKLLKNGKPPWVYH